MTKQEWRDKYKVELAPKFTPDDMADEKMTEIMTDVFVNTQADFFYSLHLQELSKIRDRIKEMREELMSCGNIDCGRDVYGLSKDDVLLAITDES